MKLIKKGLMILMSLVLVFGFSNTAKASDSSKIHFLTLDGNTLSVLVECNGEFGMIDSGEDTEYPSGEDPRYPDRSGTVKGIGFEDEVISYMKSVGVTQDNFEFYIGTHAHSDHIGSADEVIREFHPKRVYTPEYHDYYLDPPYFLFDNLFIYDEMLEAAEEVGADIILNFDPNAPVVPEQNGLVTYGYTDDYYEDEPAKLGKYEHISQERNTVGNPNFTLGGEMKIEIKNYKDNAALAPFPDANRMSLGVLVEANGKTAYVAGDIENVDGDEDRLIGELPEVDIYCMGHHGFLQANSYDFVNHLSPDVVVVPGDFTNISEIKKTSSRSSIYTVVEELATKGVPVYPTAQYGKYIPALVFNFDESLSNNLPSDVRYIGKLRFSNTYLSYKDGFPSNYTGELTYKNHKAYFNDNFITGENAFVYGLEHWMYLKNDGTYAKNTWVYDDNHWYYLDESGYMLTGWQFIDGNWYYMNGSGHMKTGWQYIEGYWYYFNGSGHMLKGWQYISGNWFYMNTSGQMKTDWQYIDGYWYYFNSSGYMKTGWQYINGNWFYMNASGQMKTGWQYIDGYWYYMNGSGHMKTGWQYIDGKWYYMNASGQMKTGWIYVDGKWYYANASGQMKTGWIYVDGKWYYMNGSGEMQKGWIYVNGKWYYMNGSGQLV